MFELPDDDDNFWESLPMDDITNTTSTSSISGTQRRDDSNDNLNLPNKRFRSHSITSVNQNANKHLNRSCRPGPSNHETIGKIDSLRVPLEGSKVDLNRNCTFSRDEILHNDREFEERGQTILADVHIQHGHGERQPTSGANMRRGDSVQSVNRTLHEKNYDSQITANNKRTSLIRGHTEDTPKRAKRKFPGPAGLLPKLSPGQRLENVSDPGIITPDRNHGNPPSCDMDDGIMSSQSGDDMFADAPWSSLLADLQENRQQVLADFSVASSLHKASKKLLPGGKVALMVAVVDTVDIQGPDASITLKDKTGRVLGTVHRDVVREYATDLRPGNAVVLKQVSVVSPTCRTHYLNITHNNIVCLYGHKDSRTPDKVNRLRSTLRNLVHTANTQPPTPKRTSPEFGQSVFGNTSSFRQPHSVTPSRTTPHRPYSASTTTTQRPYSASTTTPNSANNRQCQLGGGNSGSDSVTPKKFSFKAVGRSPGSSPVLGASPVLPRSNSPNQRPSFTPYSSNQRPPFTPNSTNQRPPFIPNSPNQRPSFTPNSTNQRPSFTPNSTNQRPSFTPNSTNQRPSFTPNSTNQRPSFRSNVCEQNMNPKNTNLTNQRTSMGSNSTTGLNQRDERSSTQVVNVNLPVPHVGTSAVKDTLCTDDLWEDELGDELISQLSEEMT